MNSKIWIAALVGLTGTAGAGAGEGRIPVFGAKFGNGDSHTYRNNIGGGNGVSGPFCVCISGSLDLGGNSGL